MTTSSPTGSSAVIRVQQILGALLRAEIADKTARSIKYQMASARLPTAKELADFDFDFAASPVNEPLIRDLAMGGFLEAKRNIMLVGGTGTGKTHLAVAIARSCIRKGARGRCYNVVDMVNHLEAELRAGRQGRTADQLVRRDFVILDELGYLPFAQAGGQLLFPPHEPALRAHLYRHHHQPRLRRIAIRLRRPQDDHSPARPPDPSLRDHRDRKRELALARPAARCHARQKIPVVSGWSEFLGGTGGAFTLRRRCQACPGTSDISEFFTDG